MYFKNQDRMLISYGNENDTQINAQLAKLDGFQIFGNPTLTNPTLSPIPEFSSLAGMIISISIIGVIIISRHEIR